MERLKGLKSRLEKVGQNVGSFLERVGPSPYKTLRNAILAGDEQKALVAYARKVRARPAAAPQRHPAGTRRALLGTCR